MPNMEPNTDLIQSQPDPDPNKTPKPSAQYLIKTLNLFPKLKDSRFGTKHKADSMQYPDPKKPKPKPSADQNPKLDPKPHNLA